MANHPWINNLKITNPDYQFDLIEKAYSFSEKYQDTTSVLHDHNSFQFGLSMAEALISLNCDSHVIAAAILYPALSLNSALTSTCQKEFDHAIMQLISGAMHMDIIHQMRGKKDRATAQQDQIDNMRKMLLAMVDDIRIVLIKLSERLVLFKNIKNISPEERQRIAQDTIDFYAPLANRLGVGHLKWQLEDYAFRYLHPNEYQTISKMLNMKRGDREHIIHDVIMELKTLFEENDIKSANITGRVKHIYSIYRKTQKKDVGIQNIYDTSAVRILVPSIQDCYTALSLVHAHWPHIPNEFDDYIAKPKVNGYQSIHTVITRHDGTVIEIQIRSTQMHENAELGVAAHWKYKENQTAQSKYENKIAWLREVMDWQKSLNEVESNAKLYQEAFKDRVYVFSPHGDVFDMVSGATPLDFAYLVHTDIGHRCRGAKVNNLLVPLTYILQTGDRIEIITGKTVHPSRDWARTDLGYLKTTSAIRKVKHWFHQQDLEKNIAIGTTLWEKTYRQHGLQKTDLNKILSNFNFKHVDSMLAALGSGDITLNNVLSKLIETEKPKGTETLPFSKTEKHSQTPALHFSVSGNAHLLMQIAKCCNPIPGDEIIGYITQGRGISVHQKNCHNIRKASQYNSERLMDIRWEDSLQKKYRVNLEILGENRAELLHDISNVLTQLNVSASSMHTKVDKAINTILIDLTIEIDHQNTLTRLLQRLKQINKVNQVVRKHS